MKRNATELEQEVFTYLNELRESGDTNMFGARPYIMAEFPDLSPKEAGEILSLWMANFEILQAPYTEIEDKNHKPVKQ